MTKREHRIGDFIHSFDIEGFNYRRYFAVFIAAPLIACATGAMVAAHNSVDDPTLHENTQLPSFDVTQTSDQVLMSPAVPMPKLCKELLDDRQVGIAYDDTKCKAARLITYNDSADACIRSLNTFITQRNQERNENQQSGLIGVNAFYELQTAESTFDYKCSQYVYYL